MVGALAIGQAWAEDDPQLQAVTAQLGARFGGVRYPWTLPIRSGYGDRYNPTTHDHRHHDGIDIALPVGTPVIAVRNAAVFRVDRDGEGRGEINGNAIILADGDFQYCYLHLSWVGIKPGQMVERCRVIGGVGTTGRSTGPHLHFQVYYRGKTLDPRVLYPGGLFRG